VLVVVERRPYFCLCSAACCQWREAAEEKGRSKLDGEQAYYAMNGHYGACHDALDVFVSAIARELLTRLYDDMWELMQEWYR
jgi:hypothetical protein